MLQNRLSPRVSILRTFFFYFVKHLDLPSTFTSISSKLPDTLLIVKFELTPTGAQFSAVPLTSGKSPLTAATKGEPKNTKLYFCDRQLRV